MRILESFDDFKRKVKKLFIKEEPLMDKDIRFNKQLDVFNIIINFLNKAKIEFEISYEGPRGYRHRLRTSVSYTTTKYIKIINKGNKGNIDINIKLISTTPTATSIIGSYVNRTNDYFQTEIKTRKDILNFIMEALNPDVSDVLNDINT